MEAIVGLIRLFFERVWYFAALVLLVSAGALLAGNSALRIPALVIDWAPMGLLVSGAVLVLQAIIWIASSARERARSRSRRDAARVRAIENAKRNVQTLTNEEFLLLAQLLRGGVARFEVNILSNGYPLMTKGILQPVRDISGTSWLCDIDPIIDEQRDEILAAADEMQRRGGF